jgi:hypothetical protein
MQKHFASIYALAKKCFKCYLFLFILFLQACNTGKLVSVNQLEIQQLSISQNIPGNINCNGNNSGESVKIALVELNKPGLIFPAEAKKIAPDKFANRITFKKDTVNSTKQAKKNLTGNSKKRPTITPWHKAGLLLILLSIVSCLGLLITPTFYVISLAILMAGFIFFNIKYTGELRKLSTILSVSIIQIDGILYVCGYYSLLAFTVIPFLLLLASIIILYVLIPYLLYKILYEIRLYTNEENKKQSHINAAKNLKKLAYIFLSLGIVFSLILLVCMNPFIFGFIPFSIGGIIIVDFIIGTGLLLYHQYFRNKFLQAK